jgi:peptide deformylase
MAILKIARLGHPVLLQQAEPIPHPSDAEIQRLIGDMIETMIDAGGVGLAAPQVHRPLRLFVFRLPVERDHSLATEVEQGIGPGPHILINPEIEPVGDEKRLGWEGCLSIPGLSAAVPRYRRIHYRGLGVDGETIDRVVDGYHAVIVQHENDHLNGILYTMRMTDFSLMGFNEEIQRHKPSLPPES